jgi:hypothetical protein
MLVGSFPNQIVNEERGLRAGRNGGGLRSGYMLIGR